MGQLNGKSRVKSLTPATKMLDTTTQPEASPSGLLTSVTLRSSIKPIYFCMCLDC